MQQVAKEDRQRFSTLRSLPSQRCFGSWQTTTQINLLTWGGVAKHPLLCGCWMGQSEQQRINWPVWMRYCNNGRPPYQQEWYGNWAKANRENVGGVSVWINSPVTIGPISQHLLQSCWFWNVWWDLCEELILGITGVVVLYNNCVCCLVAWCVRLRWFLLVVQYKKLFSTLSTGTPVRIFPG